VLAALAGVGIAPLCEEMFFREALLARILRDTPGSLAVLVSSVLFGAFHFGSGGAILVGTLCLMGAILGHLRLRTGSLGPPILLHALNNGIAILVAVLAGP
jgi:membrane protease YdiL (CAAX protease family)